MSAGAVENRPAQFSESTFFFPVVILYTLSCLPVGEESGVEEDFNKLHTHTEGGMSDTCTSDISSNCVHVTKLLFTGNITHNGAQWYMPYVVMAPPKMVHK